MTVPTPPEDEVVNGAITIEEQSKYNAGEAIDGAADDDEEEAAPQQQQAPTDETTNTNNTDGFAYALQQDDDDRTRHWKQSPYAVGLVDVDWKTSPAAASSCCGAASSIFCRCAGRVGNMVVLLSSSRSGDPLVVIGPYWPMMVCITYPLILGVTAITLWREIVPGTLHPALVAIWVIGTILLLLALAGVACRNPGILKRHAAEEHENWIWNDQALTFRPSKAKYDRDCALVVEDFDHTCPWTGTAIGKNNMCAFRSFLVLVVTMLLFDVCLLMLTVA